MVDKFPSNSHRVPKPGTTSTPDESKKIQKVVVGEVTVRRKPLGRRFLDTFLGGDTHGVMNYVIMGIIVPAVKDIIIDSISTGVERMILGESRGGRPRGYRTTQYSQPHVSYNRMAQPSRGSVGYRREEPEREYSHRARANHNVEEIIFATRIEAQTVLDRMFDLMQEYEQVTLNDLYQLVGITGSWADENYGWTDIRGTQILRTRDGGYLLDLPRTEPLK